MTDVQQRTEAETQQDRPGPASSRRVVLMGAGAIGATAALAACGTDSSGTNPNGSDFAAEPAPAGSEGAEGGSTGGGSTGTVLVAASKVDVGGGVILDELVVTQPAEGTFKAFSNVCTHQGCKVTEIKDSSIICKCHNSLFSVEDGSVVSGPAKSPLAETTVSVDGDNIVTA
ncbi:Rieske (2Fe-2S) protein [Actinoplanes derwentensis]|uniref:Cytochrome bc1 complex Rieske iron-sulfur subunit n=1 Tax=Actinoplanes derwentensis TaxID=113562 RepID=A0A1H2BWH2_9ACTN|nr:Rieske (2Fe-2S) protein [Actinoplanes derwentensis]GID83148.1 iron-sulfur protein [Actinoplanes derwentensis]SDT62422.1 Ferredoxin subunit of nitrite reductase or a ring-hydroxylating dioxygenase [Actinoplanes derwentensis]